MDRLTEVPDEGIDERSDTVRISVGNLATPFVGRPRELEFVQGALKDAAHGNGRLVLIGGEAGIGKTRLADEISRLAGKSSAEVLWGRCWEADGAPAFWPWIQLVREYAARRDRTALQSAMGAGAPDIGQLMPEFREDSYAKPSSSESIDPEQARFRQFDSLATFFRRAAQMQPLLLILDDVHWADRASLLLLRFLSQEISATRLLVVATYRTGESGRRQEDLTRILGDLIRAPSSRSLLLKGLESDDLTRLILEMTGAPPCQSLVGAVYKETEGNPLFVGEVVRLLMRDGQPIADWDQRHCKLAVPETLRDVIRSRLERLSPDAKSFLSIASVIGRDFSLRLVGRVCGKGFDDLLRIADEASAARLMQRAGYRIGEYQFTHTLIRETLYDDLPQHTGASLHRLVGEAIESTVEVGVHDSLPALSYHFSRALLTADPAKALHYAEAAACQAVAMLAYEDAIEHYHRAIAAFELIDGLPAIYCELLLNMGQVQNKAGDTDAARESFRRAAELSKSIGSTDLLARSALGFGGTFAATGTPDTELVTRLEEAIGHCEEASSAQHSMLLAGLSIALHFHGGLERRMELSERAVSMARRIDDRTAELFALDANHYALLHPAGLSRRVVIAREMTALAKDVGDREMTLRGHLRLCDDLLELGDTEDADSEIALASLLAAELRQPTYQWQVVLKQSTRAIMEGRYEEAEELRRDGLVIGGRARDERAVSSFLGQKFLVNRDRGLFADIENDAAASVARYPDVPMWRAVHLYLQIEVGRCSGVRRSFERLMAQVLARMPQDAFTLGTLGFLAETCVALRNRRVAKLLYEQLLPFRDQNITVGLAAVFLGSTAHYLGILAAVRNELDKSEAHLAYALEANVRAGARPLAARTRHEYGKVLGQLGRRDEARAQLTAAIAEFEALGMAVCLQRGRAVLDGLEGGMQTGADVVGELGGTTADMPQLADQTPTDRAMFCPDGDYWTVSFAGKTSRLKNVRGLKYIAYLLERANVPVHALDLAVLGLQSADMGVTLAMAHQESLRAADFGGRVPILDERARAEYRSRLRELAAERDEAEQLNDYGALERIDREREVLSACLSAGSETGGRARRWASPAERARVNVRNSIVTALRVIGRHHDSLHRHLQNSIKTGAVCSYVPEQQVSWQVALH